VIDGDAFDDCLQQHRLTGACRSDDECALAVADRRDEIDCATSELRPTLGWTSSFEFEFSLGVRRDQRAEIGAPGSGCRILIVDFLNVDDDDAISVVVSGGGLHLIAAAQRVLPNQLHRNIRIARLGQVTKSSAANESAFALRIEPTNGLAVWNYWREWCTWLTALLLTLSAASLTAATTTTALPASALIATAASVVAIVAMAIALVLSLAASIAAAALLLRIVLRLRL
jgi:hypothetical protein